MFGRAGNDRLLQMLLAGSPDRVLDAMGAISPDDARDTRELREGLARLAWAAPIVAPSASLRERLLAAHPRPRRPKRPVVIVLDMISDYLTPGGPLEVPRARDVVPALKQRLADARRAGVPVVYVCDSHPPDDPDFRDWPVHAVEGTSGAEVWPELAPEPEDLIVRKRTYSAFTGSALAETLDRLGADEIVLTGCATEIGLSITATDALQRGFVVTVPFDCQAGNSPLGEWATLVNLSAMPPFEPRYVSQSAPPAVE
jgi:nicotinamidase-related amidase